MSRLKVESLRHPNASTDAFTLAADGWWFTPVTITAFASPATTSAVTYKLRMRSIGAGVTTYVANGDMTGQLFAYEVSA